MVATPRKERCCLSRRPVASLFAEGGELCPFQNTPAPPHPRPQGGPEPNGATTTATKPLALVAAVLMAIFLSA